MTSLPGRVVIKKPVSLSQLAKMFDYLIGSRSRAFQPGTDKVRK